MNLRTTSSRPPLGQVFTPRPIADWMAAWACRDRPRNVLDPALGEGVFVDAVAALRRHGGAGDPSRIDGFEVDRILLDRVRVRHRPYLRIRHADFITATLRTRYDAVLANPPYVRHHHLNYHNSVWRGFDRLCEPTGCGLSRMTNLYGLFLIKIWTLLAPGGRAAVITPAEWLNADFGVSIKAHLLAENALDGIVHFDHGANIFDRVLTTAAITLLRRGRRPDEPLRLHFVRSAAQLARVRVDQGRAVRRQDLDARSKWTPLFGSTAALRPLNGPVFGDIARCTRGIATGANGFFTLRRSDLRRWRISERDAVPCITSADQIRSSVVTHRDVQMRIGEDERIFLLRPRNPVRSLSTAVKKYLAWGRERGVHHRYLPSHRPVWYMPEERPPAPILVSVFAREKFRFVWNRAGVRNLTAYHCVYPRDPRAFPLRQVVAYLCSAEAQGLMRRHCRIYADGLLKIEPRDVEKIPIPKSFVV